MVISRTPYRISFFGGGSDYPGWYRSHGGETLATSIDKYCHISCRKLPPFFEHRIRVVYSKVEYCQSLEEIQHPAVRESLRFLNCRDGLEIHHDGDLPARSGIGTSSSFVVGLLHALHAHAGRMPSKKQLAEESIHVEQTLIGETVGSQDQIMASYGGLNHLSFHTDGTFRVQPLTLSVDRSNELHSHLLLCYTGIQRVASEIAGSFVPTLLEKEKIIRFMVSMVHEAMNIISCGNDMAEFGKLLHEAWMKKRDLSTKVTGDRIDALYDAGRSAGATGGKLLGAGGGGFMLFFAPPERHAAIMEKLSDFLWIPFHFETQGSHVIFYDPDKA